jgi:hypothetical protein
MPHHLPEREKAENRQTAGTKQIKTRCTKKYSLQKVHPNGKQDMNSLPKNRITASAENVDQQETTTIVLRETTEELFPKTDTATENVDRQETTTIVPTETTELLPTTDTATENVDRQETTTIVLRETTEELFPKTDTATENVDRQETTTIVPTETTELLPTTDTAAENVDRQEITTIVPTETTELLPKIDTAAENVDRQTIPTEIVFTKKETGRNGEFATIGKRTMLILVTVRTERNGVRIGTEMMTEDMDQEKDQLVNHKENADQQFWILTLCAKSFKNDGKQVVLLTNPRCFLWHGAKNGDLSD